MSEIALDEKESSWLDVLSANMDAAQKARQAFVNYLFYRHEINGNLELNLEKKAFVEKKKPDSV